MFRSATSYFDLRIHARRALHEYTQTKEIVLILHTFVVSQWLQVSFFFIHSLNTAVWERRRRETKRLQKTNKWPLHIFHFVVF